MPFRLPLPTSVPYFSTLVLLDRITYTLRFRWNERAQSAPAWQPSTPYGPAAVVSNAGGVYLYKAGLRALTGTSASDGGPTGKDGEILDGDITWSYVRPSGSWYLDIYDSTGVIPILQSLRLVADWGLGRNNTGRQPGGLLVAFDSSGAQQDPGLDDLGARTRLLYYTALELGL